MRVLVTRPQPDAEDTAARLRGLGHAAIVSPAIEARCDPAPLLPLVAPGADRPAGLVLTSRNALRAIGALDLAALRDLPLFAVGAATAEAARLAGFATVIEGPGRAEDLAAVIAARFAGNTGTRLVHPRGEVIAFDLATALARHGIAVHEAIVYRMADAAALDPEAIDALRAGQLDAVLLLSPHTAEVFVRLIRQHGLSVEMQPVACLCLSAKVAAALGDLGCASRRVATKPNLDALIALLPAAGSDP